MSQFNNDIQNFIKKYLSNDFAEYDLINKYIDKISNIINNKSSYLTNDAKILINDINSGNVNEFLNGLIEYNRSNNHMIENKDIYYSHLIYFIKNDDLLNLLKGYLTMIDIFTDNGWDKDTSGCIEYFKKCNLIEAKYFIEKYYLDKYYEENAFKYILNLQKLIKIVDENKLFLKNKMINLLNDKKNRLIDICLYNIFTNKNFKYNVYMKYILKTKFNCEKSIRLLINYYHENKKYNKIVYLYKKSKINTFTNLENKLIDLIYNNNHNFARYYLFKIIKYSGSLNRYFIFKYILMT